jgi:hypothetical protein
MPIVTVRDPYTWMQASKKQLYLFLIFVSFRLSHIAFIF